MKDTHAVLTELKERMEGARPDEDNSPEAQFWVNAAIDHCIALVEEKLKANSKDV